MHESEESFCSFKSIARVQLLLYSLKRARCNGRHCEEESVSMDNGSRGCTASGMHRWGSELLAGRLAGSMIWFLHLSL